jgi:excisionase family DNA binding protein
MSSKLYSTREAAAAIRITRQTLQNWIAEGKIRPPKAMILGSAKVRLWTQQDVDRVRKYKEENFRKGRGPKPKRKR